MNSLSDGDGVIKSEIKRIWFFGFREREREREKIVFVEFAEYMFSYYTLIYFLLLFYRLVKAKNEIDYTNHFISETRSYKI